jgi:ubiquinone biosynthesis monooxygenase Coq7
MLDTLIIEFDRALATLAGPGRSHRPMPGEALPEADLTEEEKRHAAALMRINHVGEVCAQALYQGQALTARNPKTQKKLHEAALEEADHLAWTARRIQALGGRRSVLNPLWYGTSLVMGLAAGLAGDRWNLGFLAETERQVEAHLSEHLSTLPAQDKKSHAVLAQMKDDEAAHAVCAVELGASPLPRPVKWAMQCASGVMKTLAYRL